jgi:hypothetical protein
MSRQEGTAVKSQNRRSKTATERRAIASDSPD